MNKTPITARWQYRFENFRKAYFLLCEAVEDVENLTQLEQEGLVQHFEFCTELAWKTIKDYLESENIIFKQRTPRAILKEAIALDFLAHGQTWLDILDACNKMFHTYDFKSFQDVVDEIAREYITCFRELYETLSSKI